MCLFLGPELPEGYQIAMSHVHEPVTPHLTMQPLPGVDDDENPMNVKARFSESTMNSDFESF